MDSLVHKAVENEKFLENAKTFSIICPSRKRPESLKRLLDSIRNTANNLNTVEVLVYLDDDDDVTNPSDFSSYNFVKFYRGARVWMSLAQNFLYSKSTGSILMACADDFVFRTENWDSLVLQTFLSKKDKFWLIYGNDLGKHAGKISTHFFLHRDWPTTLGYWVNPGRNSLWDLWVYEIATDLNRVYYLKDLILEHLNFRQSTSTEVIVDETTIEITDSHTSFRPRETYKLLERERRIDVIMISDAIGVSAPLKSKYFLSAALCRLASSKIDELSLKRIKTLTNFELIKLAISRVITLRFWS